VLAPVADVSVGDADATIGSRAAGGRPSLVARHVVAAARGILSAGVLPVVKHFPGHGSLSTDSHLALAVQRRSLAQLRRTDLVPFRAAVAAGLPALMTGHIDVRAVDRGVPASISRKVTTGLLRGDLGYDGLVVTDALDMGGVQHVAPGGRAAVRALQAGADVLLMPPDPRQARDAVVRAVRSGRLPLARLEEAAAAGIDTLRGLVAHRPDQPAVRHSQRVGAARGASLELARAAVTSLAGPCTGRLVAPRIRVVGPAGDVARLDAALAARGVVIAHDVRKRVRAGTRKVVVGHRRGWVLRHVVRHGVPVVVKVRKRVAVRRKRPVYRMVTVKADAPTVALVGYGGGAPEPADVVVALDRPAVLGRVTSRVELATYGDGGTSLQALADVLVGRRPAPGHLPIDVPGAARDGC
jgi:beta-N-acetylhexosaminidase